MATRKGTKGNPGRHAGGSPEACAPEERHFNGGDIQTSRSMDGDSFEKGYPEIQQLHINQGRGTSKILRR